MHEIENQEQMRLERARKRVKALSGFYKHLSIYLVVNIVLIAMQYFSSRDGAQFFSFGTFSTAFFWGIGVVFHGLSVFGAKAFLGANWEERKIKELMERDRKSRWE